MIAISPHIDSVKYFLVLLHAFSSGSRTAHKIFAAFPEYTFLMQQNDKILLNLGVTEEEIVSLRQPRWDVIEREMHWVGHNNQHIITVVDSEYPDLLREIYNPPILLFVRGDKKILREKQLAIVGSRNPTPQGIENAYALAKNLVAKGVHITSGLALGIDAAAHRGTLAAGGKTIAVMGAGFEHIYPLRHKNLAEEIVAKGGVLLSEFPLSIAPLAGNFPQRNRIISGLSLGVLVVEATLRSGSLITARLAAEEGREVFALPGSIHNPFARGCHELIRQGAKLIESIDDILVELPPLEIITSHTNIKSNKSGSNAVNFTENYSKFLRYIDYSPTSLDTIVNRSSLTIKEIMSILLHLEIQGLVKKITGGYVRVDNY